MHNTEILDDLFFFLCSMTTAPDSPDYVLQIDMWATIESSAVTSEHARAKYNTFKVHGEFYELEVEISITGRSDRMSHRKWRESKQQLS